MKARSGPADTVLSIGRLYCDVVFTGLDAMPRLGRETFGTGVDLVAGGGAYIAAAHMSALGRRCALLARLGTDPLSAGLEPQLAASGVDLRFLERADDAGPQLTVVLTQGSERAFVSRRAGAARPATLPGALDWQRAGHLHIAEYATLHEIPDLLTRARGRSLSISLDPSWDDTLIRDPALLAVSSGADIFLPNREEATAITGDDDPARALDRLCTVFPVVAIKLGPDGAMVGTSEGERLSATAPKVPVVDTTGAGDAFNAGFLCEWLSGSALGRCLEAGISQGALSIQSIGGTRGLVTRIRRPGTCATEPEPSLCGRFPHDQAIKP